VLDQEALDQEANLSFFFLNNILYTLSF